LDEMPKIYTYEYMFILCHLLMCRCQVVVLYEATTDVNLETDHAIQEQICSKFCNCTIPTVVHRLDAVNNSDHIIFMYKGTTTEFGMPNELMEKNGLFA
ncbi:Canalicular multispecific organic anion transporter 1, partial [Coemansia furcata]